MTDTTRNPGVGRFPETSTRAELAALFGVSVKTIGNLIAKGVVIPTGKRSQYETVRSLHNYLGDLRKTAGGRVNDADIGAERLRILVVERKIAEAKLAVEEGNTISVDDVSAAWSDAGSFLKRGVLSIPRQARNAIPHLTAHDQATLDDMVRTILTDMADRMENGNVDIADPKVMAP